MQATLSLITLTYSDDASALSWVLAQEGPGVEVLLLQTASNAAPAFSHHLQSALAQASGELFLWLDPGVEFVSRHWREELLALWDGAGVDLLGLRGLSELSVHTLGQAARNDTLQLSRVVGGAHRAGIARVAASGTEPVLALGPGFVLGRTEQMRRNLEHYGAVFRSHDVSSFSLLSQLFAHLDLGVVEGVDVIEHYRHAPWATADQLSRAVGFLPFNQQSLSIWRKNLEALLRTQPDVVSWLTEASVQTEWARIEQRRPGTLRLVRESVDALVGDVRLRASAGDTAWLLGAGAGRSIDEALQTPGIRLHVVEPDAALACHLLTRHDWSSAILESRLAWHAFDAGHPLWQQLSGRRLVASFRQCMETTPGRVSVLQGGSFYLNKGGLLELERALQRAWFRHAELKAIPVNDTKVFDVTVVSPRCAIFNELAQAFHSLGYKTRLLSVPDGSKPAVWEQSRQLASNLLDVRSHLTVFRNRSLLESDVWQEPVPLMPPAGDRWMSWWWDVPNVASMLDQVIPSQNIPALGFADGLMPHLPSGSGWLPPAARPSFCCDEAVPEDQPLDISFVGQSRWNEVRTHLAMLRELLAPHLSGAMGLTHRWQWRGSAMALLDILHQDADEACAAIASVGAFSAHRGYFLDYLWRMALTGTFRMAAIEMLIREGMPVAVFGDDEWRLSGIVPEVNFGGILQPGDLRGVYRGSRINLNLNFMQVSSTINPKVMDIAACNGFVITDHREEMDGLFPEVARRPWSFDRLEDLPDLVRRALEADTRTLGLRAGQWVRQQHTLEHRARWLARNAGLPPPGRS